ncbi:MAG: alpha/beta hydrolase [Polyangiaceae bacterium]
MTTHDLPLERIGDPGAARRVLLVHGLLASGRNLRSLARTLVRDGQEGEALLVDLPGHGAAPALGRTSDVTTVSGCADVVARVVGELGVPVQRVIGHSFGGKVSLLLAERLPELEHVWTLDTRLDTDPAWRTRSDVAPVMRALRGARLAHRDRQAVAKDLEQHGLPRRVAEWLTTNLARQDDGFRWVFDLDQIEALTDDYFALDSLARLEARSGGPRVHLLRAEQGDRWTEEALTRARALHDKGVELHLLEGAGHWVHADNLPGLVALLRRG